MATFLQAMEWLRQGKKVRLPDTFRGAYWEDQHGAPVFVNGPCTVTRLDREHLCSPYWELYREPVRYFDGAEAIRLMKEGKTVQCGGNAYVMRDGKPLWVKNDPGLTPNNYPTWSDMFNDLLSGKWHLAEPSE